MQKTLKATIFPTLVMLALLGIDQVFEGLFNAYFQNIIIYCGINILLAASLNLVNGFTGQFSIGHAGFMAAGAYASAYLTMRYPHFLGDGIFQDQVAFLIVTFVGGLVAAAAGFVVGLPSLKLKGDYLAIVTLGFGEIIRVVLLNMEVVGGARGMYGITKLSNFFWIFAWAFVCLLTVWRLVRSTHGRAFLSVREDEIAAESMGIDTTEYKTKAFVLSSFFAGVAGALFAHYLAYLNPSTFSFMKSIDVVVMVVLGGMGSITGSVIAAIILTILPEALRPLQEITKTDFRMVLYSLTLVILMLTKPQGIMGTREITDLFKRKKGGANV